MKQTVSSLRRLELPRNAAEWLEAIMNFLFFLCGILAVGCVVLISAYMVISGVPAIRQIGLLQFLFGTEWASTAADPQFGILPFLLSSIYGTLGATLIGVPVGILTAIFLSEVARPGVAKVVRPAVQLLAGIPSVIYGCFGMLVIVPAIRAVFPQSIEDTLLAVILILAVSIAVMVTLSSDFWQYRRDSWKYRYLRAYNYGRDSMILILDDVYDFHPDDEEIQKMKRTACEYETEAETVDYAGVNRRYQEANDLQKKRPVKRGQPF